MTSGFTAEQRQKVSEESLSGSSDPYLLDGSLEALCESRRSRQFAVIKSSAHKERLLQVEIAVCRLTDTETESLRRISSDNTSNDR